MFTPIHQALGFKPGNLSIDLVNAAVAARLQESSHLDWKRDLYSHNSQGQREKQKPWQEEAAKDIAAMANSGGGWIFFGVQEDPKTGSAREIWPIDWNPSEEQKLRQVAWNQVSPPVTKIEFFPLPAEDEKFVLAMRVPDSTRTPHLAMKEGSFRAPIRNGSHTEFMRESDIEKAYRRRFNRIEDEEKHLQTIFDYVSSTMGPDCGLRFVAVATPNEKHCLSQPLTDDELHQALSRLSPLLQLSTCDEPQRTASWESGNVRRSLRSWLIRAGGVHQSKHFLYDDGSVAYCRHIEMPEEKKLAPGTKAGLLKNQCRQKEVETCVIDFVSLLHWYAKIRCFEGGYRIRIGLVTGSTEPIYIRVMEPDPNPTGLVCPIEASDPIFWFENLTLEFDPLASSDELQVSTFELATDILNQAGISRTCAIQAPLKDPGQ